MGYGIFRSDQIGYRDGKLMILFAAGITGIRNI